MRKTNAFLVVGISTISFTLIAKQFIPGYPHFLIGAGFGLGLILEGMGFYLNSHDAPEWMKRKKQWIKKRLLGRC